MDMKQAHAAAIEMYINDHVGLIAEGEYGAMYFNNTLNDWSKFDINNRTKYDASISSGLAIMACHKELYRPVAKQEKTRLSFSMAKYDQRGSISKIIK
jgi:hypothetical protein